MIFTSNRAFKKINSFDWLLDSKFIPFLNTIELWINIKVNLFLFLQHQVFICLLSCAALCSAGFSSGLSGGSGWSSGGGELSNIWKLLTRWKICKAAILKSTLPFQDMVAVMEEDHLEAGPQVVVRWIWKFT